MRPRSSRRRLRSTTSIAITAAVEVAGVPHHVAVGVVDPHVVGTCRRCRRCSRVGDLGRLHPRPLLEGRLVARAPRRSALCRSSSKVPLRLPLKKYVTWPNFCVSLHGEAALAGLATGTRPTRASIVRRRHQEVRRQRAGRRRTASCPAKRTVGDGGLAVEARSKVGRPRRPA